MPRTAREISNTGIYHIILRGINRQAIFEDEEDAAEFLRSLINCSEYIGAQKIIDAHFALSLFSNDKEMAIKEFEIFHDIPSCDTYLDADEKLKLKDDEAKEKIMRICNVTRCFQMCNYLNRKTKTNVCGCSKTKVCLQGK